MEAAGDPKRESSPGHSGLKTAAAALFSFAAGSGLAVSMGYGEAAVSAGLVSTFVVAAAVAVPGPVSYRAGIASALIATVGLLIAEVGTDSPVLAGLAMALVCLVTSLSYAGGKTATVVGLMLGTAYFLPAVLGLVDQVGAGTVAELGAIGLAVGLMIALTLAGVERLTGRKPEKAEGTGPAGDDPSAVALMWQELRAFGPDARSGLRRALLLGIAMGAYQADGNHNLFWILLTMYIVLQPDLERTWNKALSRSAGTLGGALVVGAFGQLLPNEVMVGLGIFALIVGFAYYRTSYTIYAACVTFLAVAIYGAESGSFFTWAALRVADTLIGGTIALVGVYVLFPIRGSGTSRQ